MALKQLVLAKKLRDKNGELAILREQETELETKQTELERAVEETTTDEELDLLQDSERELNEQKNELLEKKQALENQISELEAELEEIEEVVEEQEEKVEEPKGERNLMSKLITRGAFQGMQSTDVEVLLKRDNVQAFVNEVRTAMKEKRALTGGEYVIPTDVMGIVRDETYRQSKLLPYVTLHRLSGEGRVIVAGAIPEAVWTEQCATLNELDLTFSQVELDGYKVGGYVAVCNALVEDSDFDLANFVLTAIAEAIAKAIDKAILYGTNTKMPKGVVKALADGSTGLSAVAKVAGKQWIDALAKLNVISHGATEKLFVMNETTFNSVQADAMQGDLLPAVISAGEGKMPLGGNVLLVDFVPNDVIIGGYFKNYVMAERSGVKLARSEHAQFIQDNTVFKGTARYDGDVAHLDSFKAIKFGASAPTALEVTFATDEANA